MWGTGKILMAALGALLIDGCASQSNLPLIFGQSHTVGISIDGNATEGGAGLTIGYKDRDIAIVPVTVQQANEERTQLEATVAKGYSKDQQIAGQDKDAFSVLGQFELNTETGSQAKVGLGKFFATGLAARRLADGFACTMNEGKDCKTGLSQNPAPAATP